MYQISEVYSNFWKRDFKKFSGIVAERISSKDASWLENYTESFSFYAFTLVISGWIKIRYDKGIIELTKNSFHLYLPGSEFSLIDVSEDYEAFCVVSDEGYILDLPCMEKLLLMIYSPGLLKLKGLFSLSESDYQRMFNLFSLIELYSRSSFKYRKECIEQTFSTLIYDLSVILELNTNLRTTTENLENLFFKFFQLLKDNFRDRHYISYYSEKLGITPEYLSRIVKKISGKTVISLLNRMLVTEASWKLIHSQMSMAEIATYLNFASSASLCKFFKTQKGISPLKYRQLHIKTKEI